MCIYNIYIILWKRTTAIQSEPLWCDSRCQNLAGKTSNFKNFAQIKHEFKHHIQGINLFDFWFRFSVFYKNKKYRRHIYINIIIIYIKYSSNYKYDTYIKLVKYWLFIVKLKNVIYFISIKTFHFFMFSILLLYL